MLLRSIATARALPPITFDTPNVLPTCNRIVPLGERRLRKIVFEFVDHYHRERNHQSLDNRLIEPPASAPNAGPIKCRERLGGVLNFYFREAA